MIVNQELSGAEIADRLGVRPQTFLGRAKKYGFPRLANGKFALGPTLRLWNETLRGNGHGGWRPNAGAKPKLAAVAPRPALHPTDAPIEALLDELMADCQNAPWPGVFEENEAGRRHSFTIAEARAALAEVPLAREWLLFSWLTGGSWMPEDDEEVAADETECRRELVREALGWLVPLYRRAIAGAPRRSSSG